MQRPQRGEAMPVVLYRVDERLIHGQVIVGWGSVLHPNRIVVVDDEIAASDWEQELYVMGLPPEMETEFVDVAAAREQLSAWRDDERRTIVLTRNVGTMRRLGEGGTLAGTEINIGGIHHAPGRRPVLPYVFLSPEETAELRELAAQDARIAARDLPASRAVSLDHLVAETEGR